MLAILSPKVKYLFNRYAISLIAIIGSLLTSYIVLLHRQPFNVDGILYLQTASVFLSNGFQAAMHVYPWPFYSVLIAVSSHITGLSLQQAALVINAILNTITILAFVGLTKQLGGSRQAQYWALVVILLYPYFVHDKDNILRDFGYYAFLLVSLQFFIRYLHTLMWRDALGWAASLLLAFLFRIEGGILLLLIPLTIFLKPQLSWLTRLRSCLKLYSLHFIAILIGIIWLLVKLHHHDNLSTVHGGRLRELFGYFYSGPAAIQEGFLIKAAALKQSIFATNPFVSVPAFLTGGIIGILVDSFLATIGLFYLVLVYYAFRSHAMRLNQDAALAWKSYIVFNIVVVVVFVLLEFFLAQRYIAPLCLLLLLAAPFSLEKLYASWLLSKTDAARKKWLFPAAVFFLLVTAVSAFGHFGPSKTYLIDAGTWLNKNTVATAKVFSTSSIVSYYSHRQTLDVAQDGSLTISSLAPYDYAAVQLMRGQAAAEQHWITLLKRQPIVSFHNHRGDQVLIFQLNASSTNAGDNSTKQFK